MENILKNFFHEIDLFDFTSFFGLDFFKFSGPLCMIYRCLFIDLLQYMCVIIVVGGCNILHIFLISSEYQKCDCIDAEIDIMSCHWR